MATTAMVVAFLLLFLTVPLFHGSTFEPPCGHRSDDGKTSDGCGSTHPRTCTGTRLYRASLNVVARVSRDRQLRELSIDSTSAPTSTLFDDLALMHQMYQQQCTNSVTQSPKSLLWSSISSISWSRFSYDMLNNIEKKERGGSLSFVGCFNNGAPIR